MSMFMDDGTVRERTKERKRTTLAKGTLYILNEDDGDTGGETITIHEQKVEAMRKFFKECSDYKICVVPSINDQKEFLKWWTKKLAPQADNEVAIIYFHGTSGGNGKKFGLALLELRLNAFAFFELLTKCEKNVLMLLDCFLPTRFHEKNSLQRRLTCETAFEVIACGYPGQDIEGKASTSRFTDCIIRKFRELINKANEDDQGAAKGESGAKSANRAKGAKSAKGAAKIGIKRQARFSIPHMLVGCKELNTNPVRLWSSLPKDEYVTVDKEKVPVDKIVPRLFINPATIRSHKKIVFMCEVIKDTEKTRKAEQAAAKAAEQASRVDEGFEERVDEDESIIMD